MPKKKQKQSAPNGFNRQTTNQSDSILNSSPGKSKKSVHSYNTIGTSANFDMWNEEDELSDMEEDLVDQNAIEETQMIDEQEEREISMNQNGYYKSKEFLQFEDDMCQAYNVLRKNGNKLINLLLLMLSAGMPELNT